MHPQKKTLAQQLAEKSGGKYTQQQIEDQMRQISMTEGGQTYAGSPDILIGDQRPTDAEVNWVYAGETADGNPILAQAMVANDTELQRYIVDTVRNSDVRNTISYTAAPMQPELGPRRYAQACGEALCDGRVCSGTGASEDALLSAGFAKGADCGYCCRFIDGSWPV
ncbi:hypothetical protein KQH49_04990 [Mycetohabitans sp. B5]|uniref:Uncharacterized protein n=1 Tax=Mycetohabitans endofungorum TaxID=417203 RepID=A0A2P5KBH2_9BURK|nr:MULTISPECIES: hypothetical protein [Mycetohabitans]MCG1054351.1 hypothetical protein [Mycetohabitans sp. B5]PPB84056.1 hypothetical protein B0O95_1043 [Mycetohabitans endofungorum]